MLKFFQTTIGPTTQVLSNSLRGYFLRDFIPHDLVKRNVEQWHLNLSWYTFYHTGRHRFSSPCRTKTTSVVFISLPGLITVEPLYKDRLSVTNTHTHTKKKKSYFVGTFLLILPLVKDSFTIHTTLRVARLDNISLNCWPITWSMFSIIQLLCTGHVYVYYLRSHVLLWHHNGRDGVLNHQPHDCLLSRLFRRRSKKTSKLRVTGFCAGNSPVTGEFPAQMASNSENVSIWWHHRVRHRCLGARISNCMSQYSMRCNYVSLSQTPASD